MAHSAVVIVVALKSAPVSPTTALKSAAAFCRQASVAAPASSVSSSSPHAIRWAFNIREWNPSPEEWELATSLLPGEDAARVERFKFDKVSSCQGVESLPSFQALEASESAHKRRTPSVMT